jgi:hypothetical protein
MTRFTRPVALLAAVGLALVVYAAGPARFAERPDCPGKIVCPLTGELVCRDQCPTADPARPDCPGRIECPQTGELVCRDRCPVADADEAVSQLVPACCCAQS